MKVMLILSLVNLYKLTARLNQFPLLRPVKKNLETFAHEDTHSYSIHAAILPDCRAGCKERKGSPFSHSG